LSRLPMSKFLRLARVCPTNAASGDFVILSKLPFIILRLFLPDSKISSGMPRKVTESKLDRQLFTYIITGKTSLTPGIFSIIVEYLSGRRLVAGQNRLC